MKNIPNILTTSRIILIPIFVLVFYLPFKWNYLACAVIFALAAVTDWLDGYLARALSQVSPFGEFLDPVADKLIVAVALVLIVSKPHMHFLAIPAAIIVGREIVISALREWMAELGKRASVAVSFVGKFKTAVQLIALTILIGYRPGQTDLWVAIVGYILIYIAAVLTLWSMYMYLKAAWPNLVVAK
ncbi:MAG: CDP-diacylglycerol--glycerol-3-phosphate 3-phosphatidyltransferase [Gammaproteobacteria bacterium]